VKNLSKIESKALMLTMQVTIVDYSITDYSFLMSTSHTNAKRRGKNS